MWSVEFTNRPVEHSSGGRKQHVGVLSVGSRISKPTRTTATTCESRVFESRETTTRYCTVQASRVVTHTAGNCGEPHDEQRSLLRLRDKELTKTQSVRVLRHWIQRAGHHDALLILGALRLAMPLQAVPNVINN